MKTPIARLGRNKIARTVGILSALSLNITPAIAQQYLWVPGANPLNWDTATVNWDEDPFGGVAEAAWVNGNVTANALFTNFVPGVGPITVGPNVDTNVLTVAAPGFSFNGGNINFIGTNASIANASGAALDINSGVSAADTLIVSGGSPVNLNGGLAGTNGLIAFGAGTTTTLNGAASFSGPAATITNASGANLLFGNTLTTSGDLTVTGGDPVTVSGVTSIGAALTVNAATGFVTSSALNVAAGVTVSDAGTNLVANAGLGAVGDLIIQGGSAATLTGGANVGSATVIGAASTLTVNTGLNSATDLFVVDGALANFSGTVNVAGQLVASGAGTVLTTNGPLNTGGNITVATNAAAFFNGAVGGTGQVLVTDGSTAVLSGANTYSGGTTGFGAGATIIANGGIALPDDGAVSLFAGANLIVNADETIASLSGDAASGVAVSNVGQFLTVGNDNSDTSFAGVISGGGGLTKVGTGTLTLSGANTYADETFVIGGSIVASSDDALGSAAAGTTIVGDAQLGFTGGITTSENLNISYGGPSFVFGTANVASDASILNISGNNILGGNITAVSDTARINSDADSLIIASAVTGPGGANDLFAFGGPGDVFFAPGSSIGGGIEWVYKDGTGTLNLSGSAGNNHTGGTIMLDGTIIINSDDDLGTGDLFTFGTSTLQADTTGGPVSLAGKDHILVGGVTSIIDVTGPDTLTMDLAGVQSSAGPNTIQKTGAGTLVYAVNNGEPVPTPLPPGTPKAQAPLFAPTGLTFGGAEAAFLDPVSGGLVIDNSANAQRASVTVAGLGNTTDPSLSLGTVNLVNANLIVDGAVPTFFGGTIIGDGNIGIKMDTLLDAANPGFTGQVSVYNGATLTVGDAGALGTAGNYDFNGTYVDAGSTVALNDLGGTALNEGITLFNNARLISNTGINNLDSQLQIEHDLNAAPNSQLASVGVIDGQLNLVGGIEAHNTGLDMSVALNTEAGQNGVLAVAGAIAGNVQNVLIGEATSSGTVVLGTNNSYAGNTQIFGGTVFAGANGAFSNGLVNVVNDTTLATPGVLLANDFALNGGATLSTSGLTQMNGGIAGLGGLTVLDDTLVLNGPNTFSGATQVDAGATLLVGNTFESTQVTVDGVLGTTTSNVLNDATQMTINAGGTFALGGAESIRSIGGDGIVDTNIYALGLSEGSFDGDIIGLGDVNKTSNGILTLNNPQSFLGSLNVLDGTVNLGAAGGLATPDISISDGGTLATGGSEQLLDTADLQVDGVLSLGGDETIGTLNGGSTGVVDLDTFGLTVFDGTFAGSITNAHGDLNKTGPGTLALSGTNTYVGETHVEEGVLTLTATGSLTNTSAIDIDGGAVLNLNGSNQVNDLASIVLNFDGPGNATLNVTGTETVAAVQDINGGGIIGGGGVLTATSYSLNGTTVNADLGNGALGSSGSSTINGDSNANSVIVVGGTLTLNGNLTNVTGDTIVGSGATLDANGTIAGDTVTVNAGGTLNTGSGERLANDVTLTVDGAAVLGGDETVGTLDGSGTVDNGGNLLSVDNGSFSGVISGGGGLAKDGTGTLTLDGVQTFTGPTDVNAGTLALGAAGGLASTTINIDPGATLTTGGNEQLSDLATVLADGTLNLGGDETIATLNGGGTVDLDTFALTVSDGVFSGTITNAHGDLNKTGPGTLILSGTNTYSGATHVEEGVLTLTATGSLTNTSAIDIDAGATVNLNGSHQVNDAAAVNLNFDAAGNATLNVTGTETVGSLTDVNGGGFVNGGGTLTATTYGLDGTTVNANLGTGALTSTGATTLNGDGNMDTTTVTGGTLTLNGDLTNTTGDVTVNGGATLDANGTIAADDVTVDATGTLNTGSAERLADDATLTANGSVNLGGDETIGTLDGSGAVNNNGNLLTVGDGSFGGVISGSGGLDKTGLGTLTLTGANTYTGETQVLGGTLDLSGGSIASVDVTVAQLGTLNINGSSLPTNANVTVDGIMNVGGDTTIANLFGGSTGQVNLGSSILTLGGVDFGGVITGTGGINVQGGNLTLGGNNTFTGTTLVSTGTTILNGTIDSSLVTIDPGAELQLGSSHRIIDTATINVDGTLNMNGDEELALANISGTVNGNGELTAANYALTDGAQVDADLGTGDLTSSGATTLNGDGNMDTTTVTGGTLTLNGDLTNTTGDVTVNNTATLDANGTIAADDVTVNDGGTLNTGSDERLANDANLTVDGTVNLGGAETVGTLDGAASGLVANNGNDLTVGDGTYAGDITGSGDLNKVTTGTLTLDSPVAYSGDTNVMEGVLTLGSGGGLTNSLNIEVESGATLNTGGNEQLNDGATLLADGQVNLGGDETITTLNGSGVVDLGTFGLTVSNGAFAGTIQNAHGDLNKVSPGTLILSGTNTYTGATHVEEGVLSIASTGSLTATSDIDINAGATVNLFGSHQINDLAAITLNFDGAGNATLNVTGAETVGTFADLNGGGFVNGGGTLTATTYSLNGTTVNADLGTGDLTSTGASTLNGDGDMDTTTVTGGTLTLNGDLTNTTGDVTVNGGATLDANGTIAADDVTVDATGTLNTGSDERLASDVNLTVDGTVNLGGDETVGTLDGAATGLVANDGNDFTVDDGTYAGDITGSGDLNKISNGTLTLDGPVAYSGDTNVMEGVLTLGAGGGLTNSLNIEVDTGATLNTGGNEQLNDGATLLADGQVNLGGDETIMTLNGGGGVELNSFDLTVDDGTFGGTISGTGNLNKESAGTLALTGANTFSGDTNVNLGALELSGTLVNTANVNVGNGATLDLLSSERINDAAVLSAVTGGTVNLNGIETVADFNLGGLLRGTGRINAATYDLTDGAETQAGADMGDGILTSNGDTLLGGDSGANTVLVQTGTMTVNGAITNPLGLDITISSGATMALGFDERLGDNAVVNNFGELDLNGDETIMTYNADGGFLDETGVLTALTYNLSNGASTAVGADLGTGILNSGPGTVTLNGDAAVETANILSGTLNLNGELTDVMDVNISGGATVNLGSDERINDAATVNNDGTLNLSGVETITTYNSTGTLGGTGTLVADTYNLEAGSITNPGANLGGGVLNVGCNTPGVIAINGDAAAEDVTVCTGSTLNLGGQLTGIGTDTTNPGDNLTIESGATLNLSATSDQINNDGVVINDGTLNLHGAETVGSFISSGTLGLAGGAPVPSILTTQGNTINLLDGHVSLIGTGLAGIGPDPQLTSDGNVLISGTANDTTAANNATLDVNTAIVQSGTLTLNGLLISDVNANPDLTVNSGATLISGSANRITDTATVTIDNGGVWNLGSGANNGNDTITTFNAGGQLNNGGPGISTLTADTYNLTGGAEINANLGTGVLNSNNSIENLDNTLNGDAAVGDANITSGVFNLNGQLTVVNTVDISSGAIVNLGSSERINNGAIVNNFGELDLNGTETVTTYNSDGGFLDNTGLLTATTYNLRDGASTDVGADLGNTGTFNSNGGTVTLNGKLNADFIEINDGSLVTNGAVGDVNTGRITVDSTATWFVNSSYDYDVLRGVGTVDPGGSNGNTFTNRDTISPGYDSIGELDINGDYIEDGVYVADLGPSPTSDTLDVNGFAYLDNNSVLRLGEENGLDSGNVLCGERWNIIDSFGTIGDFNSNFDRTGFNEITDVDNTGPNGTTFDSQVLFDRGSGDVVALGLGLGETVADYPINQNQINILSVVLDDATDGVGNYNSNDGAVGTVLDAVYTFGAPGDKDAMAEAINRLSPESYAGLADYALHVTRSYTQNATLLRARRGSSGDFMVPLPDKSSAKGGVPSAKGGMYGAKGGMSDAKGGLGPKEPYAPAPTYHDYELFGGISYLSVGTDGSNGRADYDLESYGGYAGFRKHVNMNVALGGFLGIDSGSIGSSSIGADLDSDGFVLGAFANYTPEGPDGPWLLWANMSYGSYEFHGHRDGLLARYRIRDVEAEALQVGVGGGYRFYETDTFSLSAGAGLRWVDADVDGFTERGGAGALVVSDQKQDALLLDLNLQGLYQEPGSPVAVYGEVGWQHNFADTDRDIDATFVGGSTSFSVNAPGLDEDAFTYGIGVIYDIDDRYQLGAGYRGEWRSDSDAFHGFDVNVTVGF